MTTLTSRNGVLEFGANHPTMLVNDQLYVINKPADIIEPLSRGDISYFLKLARWGKNIGTDMTALLITHPEIDEIDLLPKLAWAVHNETGAPIGLDSRNPEAIEAALAEISPFKAIIWTVTAESNLLDLLLPIAKRYGAVVAGMPMGRKSIQVPMTAGERIEEASYIIQACQDYGIPREDIVIDAVCMPASLLLPNSYRVTLETIAILTEMGITTQLGIGNSGSNMPDPLRINLAYLLGALTWGLDAAFINPAIDGLIPTVRAMDMLTERDPECRRYLQHWRSHQSK